MRTPLARTHARSRERDPRMRWGHLYRLAIGLALLAGACGGGGGRAMEDGEAGEGDTIAAEVASFDLVAGRTGRFTVGLFSLDKQRLVAFGDVRLAFEFVGDGDGREAPEQRVPAATAAYLPIPGQALDASFETPRLVPASEATGVYGVPEMRFDQPGFWQVVAGADFDGRRQQATAAFQVLESSSIPAPGQRAPTTDHPVAGAPGVDPSVVDSRAAKDVPVPDPELHDTTVAAALGPPPLHGGGLHPLVLPEPLLRSHHRQRVGPRQAVRN